MAFIIPVVFKSTERTEEMHDPGVLSSQSYVAQGKKGKNNARSFKLGKAQRRLYWHGCS